MPLNRSCCHGDRGSARHERADLVGIGWQATAQRLRNELLGACRPTAGKRKGMRSRLYEQRCRPPRNLRVFYVATIGETGYVLHAFQKNTQKTSKADLDLAKQRYGEIGNER